MSDQGIHRALGEITGELKGINQRLELSLKRMDKHEERIAGVEKKVWYGTGIGAALAVVASKLLGNWHG